MDDDDHDMACTLDLSLELGLGGYSPKKEKQKVNHDIVYHDDEAKGFNMKRSVIEENQHLNEESTNHTNDKNGSRKKLRLTKEQSAMLEDTFKLRNTINPAQKRALAEQLNLNLRQVEVWFQNRRARTKLKQTEVNCAFLMKCREKLTEENLKLKKELEELHALKVGARSSPSKAENWTVCSSCKKLLRPNNDEACAAISSSTIELEGIMTNS